MRDARGSCDGDGVHLVPGLHVSCMCPACVLHEACMLLACVLHEACMWPACALHVACMLLACGLHVACTWPAWGLHGACMGQPILVFLQRIDVRWLISQKLT